MFRQFMILFLMIINKYGDIALYNLFDEVDNSYSAFRVTKFRKYPLKIMKNHIVI